MIRVYPSSLDGFQYYLDSNLSTKAFIMRECRLDKKNIWANAGTAMHKFIEDGGKHQFVHLQDGQSFKMGFTRNNVDVEIPRAQISEFRMAEKITACGEPAIISGRVDGMIGNRLLEYKCVKRMNLERFIDSWQWRCYLAMDDRFSRVDYHVFKIRFFKVSSTETNICVDQHRRITMQRYRKMKKELYDFISEYVEHLLLLESLGFIHRTGNPPMRMGWAPGPNFNNLED